VLDNLNPRKKPVSLWKAALYGAGFMVVVRLLGWANLRHRHLPGQFLFPSTPDQAVEFVAYLMFGVLLFVSVASISNWWLGRRSKRDEVRNQDG
jgi:hypothetical protein